MVSVGMLLLLFIITFLLGSIPWGVIISKVFFKKDLRNEGSGNIGTTNAMRSIGKVGGCAVFVLDFCKGLLSGWIGYFVWGRILTSDFATSTSQMFSVFSGAGLTGQIDFNSVAILCASVSFLGCVWGHIFSPWLGFKGGKGIAVAVGCEFFAVGVIGTVIEIALFAITVISTRFVSLGSIIAAGACPVIALWSLWGNWAAIILITIAAITVLWAHRGNMSRLMRGNERKIGSKKQGGASA